MELTHQTFSSLLEMPYSFFEEFYNWKIDIEKEKIKRQKNEFEQQKKLNTQLEGKRKINETKSRLNSNKIK